VGHKGNETSVSDYVRNQGRANEYKQIHREDQLSLFDDLAGHERSGSILGVEQCLYWTATEP